MLHLLSCTSSHTHTRLLRCRHTFIILHFLRNLKDQCYSIFWSLRNDRLRSAVHFKIPSLFFAHPLSSSCFLWTWPKITCMPHSSMFPWCPLKLLSCMFPQPFEASYAYGIFPSLPLVDDSQKMLRFSLMHFLSSRKLCMMDVSGSAFSFSNSLSVQSKYCD